jgi:membrane associated rhomboid family serine protease
LTSEIPSHSDTRESARRREPIFNALPGVVLVLAAAVIAVTAAQLLGPPDLYAGLLAAGALIGGGEYSDVPQPYGPLAPLVLHVFLHGGWIHLFINMAAMASFGPGVALGLGRGPRGWALFLAFFFACAIGGGLAQEAVFRLEDSPGTAIGASSALSGFLPAIGYLQGGFGGALRTSTPWLLINLALAVTGFAIALPIAWAAHLGGLAAGLVLFPLFMALRAPRGPRGPWE